MKLLVRLAPVSHGQFARSVDPLLGVAAGGRLVLTMSKTPGHWGERDLPPSTGASH
jgi:hypothetical protein